MSTYNISELTADELTIVHAALQVFNSDLQATKQKSLAAHDGFTKEQEPLKALVVEELTEINHLENIFKSLVSKIPVPPEDESLYQV